MHKTVVYIKRTLIDFLFIFKDKHPFSEPEEGKVMDVFDIVMDSMYELGLEPSNSLKEEYRKSEFNKKLNTFPDYEYLNSLFNNGMDKERYEFMKMRFESRPHFVYYFNPDIQLEENFGKSKVGTSKVRKHYYKIGINSKGTKVSLLNK